LWLKRQTLKVSHFHCLFDLTTSVQMPKRKASEVDDVVSTKQGEAVASRAADEDGQGLVAWEKDLWAQGFNVIAGTDEAGRGPLAGPVVAAAFAVIAHEDEEVRELLSTVSDSKQMSAMQREEAFSKLTDPKFEGRTVWAIAEASVEEIESTNILLASLSAMAQSVRALKVRPDCVLVDGCNRPPDLLQNGEGWTRGPKKRSSEVDTKPQSKLSTWFASQKKKPTTEKWRPRRVDAVIDGDARVASISAASVLAKVHRDRLMDELHVQFPHYDFASNKGYGTAAHMEAIQTHGASSCHRRSFVEKMIPPSRTLTSFFYAKG